MSGQTYRVGYLCCGSGLGAKGFVDARPIYIDPVLGIELRARFETAWGVDVDRNALVAFEALARGPGFCLDLFDRAAFTAFHGREPGPGWSELTAEDFRLVLGPEAPDVIFSSPPCVGMSRLLSAAKASSAKYRAVNGLVVRALRLTLDAWADRPPKVILLENVPGLEEGRGEGLLGEIVALLTERGYSTGYGSRCLGEIGNLAQRRRRFTLVARHRAQVPSHLFQPPPRGLRGVGDVLGPLPLPGDPAAGPMHQLGKHTFQTWIRLALIPPGKDWRALRDLNVDGGHLRDYAIECGPWRAGTLGVTPWEEPAGTITGETSPTNGPFSVADPIVARTGDYGSLGVQPWGQPMGTITGTCEPGSGRYSVADPRPGDAGWHHTAYRVAEWDGQAGAVTAQARPSCGCGAIQDPRPNWGNRFTDIYRIVPWSAPAGVLTCTPFPTEGGTSIADPRIFAGHNNKLRVVGFEETAQAITAGAAPSAGLQAIAYPGAAWMDSKAREGWIGTGPFGVQSWAAPAGAVTASGDVQNSAAAVADPRMTDPSPAPGLRQSLPKADERGVFLILSPRGAWHRPITALEAGVLQGLDPGDLGCGPASRMVFAGASSTAWRKEIGNGVPVAAALAIAEVVGRCLLAAEAGVAWELSTTPIWARSLASALSIDWPANMTGGN